MNAPDSFRPLEDFEKEADEAIAYGDVSDQDLVDAILNAMPKERSYLRKHLGVDNCAVGTEFHRLVREELIRKLSNV